MTRRRLLAIGAGLLAGCGRNANRSIAGSFVGASHDVGHLLRSGSIPAPSSERRARVVIVGAGVAGLSAGWYLQRHGFHEFEILELENEAGGNSRFGQNRISPYPWGAHYVPLPTRDSTLVRDLFEELGVITGFADGQPLYKEEYLCFDPQERLYIHGRWQEGLIPALGTTERDREDFERFKDLIDSYKARNAFKIPMGLSARDKDVLELDSLSVRELLNQHGLHSSALHWYVDYACRDDFGCRSGDVSAWAGIHYFASRDVDDAAVLTWPEGNGWIIKRLREKLAEHIRPGSLAFKVGPRSVDVFDVDRRTSFSIQADRIIFACPTFLARHLMGEAFRADTFEYAPWLVANLTLDAFPEQRTGAPIAWDNVIYDSESLGYVVATHQSLRTYQPETVLTYYLPLTGVPQSERKRLLETDWSTWVEFILADLSRPHPDIRQLVRHVDIMRWGHAMVRPHPGFMFGRERSRFTSPMGNIHFAHSDLSGFSIFEEAQYRGVKAAEWVLG